MTAAMPRRFYKYKLLLDEGFLLRTRLPISNSRFNLKHIKADLGHEGLKDEDVYKAAIKLKRLVVTFNDKDFQKFAESSPDAGVIGISANITNDQIDKKLTALLMKSKKSDLFGKFNYISGES